MEDRLREAAVVTASPKRKRWIDLKARLETFDRAGLVGLVADLYEASPANRRYLGSRLFPQSGAIEEYRRMVVAAIYPDPFSQRRVSVRDASAAITEYRRATGDVAGAVDLMLTFVEAGTEQAADLGYGDDSYFKALETKLNAIAKLFDELPASARAAATSRLRQVRKRGKNIGWGYGDLLDDVVTRIESRAG
jgi:hypothetical protein